MEVRVLRYFLAVAQEESITGAAEYLHLTQPTLSRQLMDLEDELGKKLFVRGNRKVTLTEDGLLLRKRATEIIDLVDKTESEFRAQEESVAGDIYIGAGETDAMRLLARVAKELQQRHPLIHYHLYSGNAQDVTERLDKGLLDFGILIQPVDLKKYDNLRIPATDTWGLLMPRDHPLAARRAIRPEDLLDIPLLVSRQSMVRDFFSSLVGKGVESLHIVATYNLIYNAAILVDEGLGCALTLDKLANTSESSTLCFRPLEPNVEVELDVVWKKYQVFSKAAEKFLELLHERFQEMGGDGDALPD